MTQNTVTSSLWQIVFSILFTASCMANELPATQGDAVPLVSESKEELPSTQGDNIPLISESKEKMLDSGQEKASAMLVDVSRWFDNFFDDDRFLDEENKTRAKLKTTLEYSENDDFDFKVRVNLRFHLPKLSKKANLIIAGRDNDDLDLDDNASDDPTDKDRNELSATIQYFLKSSKKFNISTSFGGSYNYLYGGLRFRHFHNFGPWQARFINQLRYYTDDGWENKMSYDIERHFSSRWLFRTTAAINYYEEEDGFLNSLKFRLYQILDTNHAITYELFNYFETEPEHKLTDTQVRLRYRQRFYRDWLVLEIAPEVSFPEDHDREINPGIAIQFEVDFGYLTNLDIYKSAFKVQPDS